MENIKLSSRIYRHLYNATANPTPIRKNCGELCGRACCRPAPRGELGIYLFPGEETMFSRRENWLTWEEHDPVEHGFPVSWNEPVYFVRCSGSCPREMRPLACRFFPLAPHLNRDGSLRLIYETLDLPYRCPLITSGTPLEPRFINMVETAWEILLRDRRIGDLVREDSRLREENGLPVQVVSRA
ncbi:MAG: hypothetical protein MJA84_06175 [Firmicutes bacterium]|nr:hypothetical protein [Bacillota bacterium]